MGQALDLWPGQIGVYIMHMHRVHIRLNSVHAYSVPIPVEYLHICATAVYLTVYYIYGE